MYGIVEDTPYITLSKYSRTRRHYYRGQRIDLSHSIVHDSGVDFTTTPCNYGGKRFWLICQRCGKKKLTLYYIRGKFECVKCGELLYERQTMDKRKLRLELSFLDYYYYRDYMTRLYNRPFYKGVLTKRARRILNKIGMAIRYDNLIEIDRQRKNAKVLSELGMSDYVFN